MIVKFRQCQDEVITKLPGLTRTAKQPLCPQHCLEEADKCDVKIADLKKKLGEAEAEKAKWVDKREKGEEEIKMTWNAKTKKYDAW